MEDVNFNLRKKVTFIFYEDGEQVKNEIVNLVMALRVPLHVFLRRNTHLKISEEITRYLSYKNIYFDLEQNAYCLDEGYAGTRRVGSAERMNQELEELKKEGWIIEKIDEKLKVVV